MMHQQTHLGGVNMGQNELSKRVRKRGETSFTHARAQNRIKPTRRGKKHLIRSRADGKHAIKPPHTVCPNHGFKFSVGAWLARNGRRMVNWPLARDWVAARLCQKRTSGLRKSYITNKRIKNSGLYIDTYILKYICRYIYPFVQRHKTHFSGGKEYFEEKPNRCKF